jgi:hypothetical protein
MMPAARKRNADANGNGAAGPKKPIILPNSETVWLDRRHNGVDRRHRVVDPTLIATDRRTGSQERRVNGDRRQTKQDRRSYAITNTGTIQ